MAVGAALVYSTPAFSFPAFALTMAGAILVHAAANLANTYYDFVNGLDTKEHSDDRALVDGWFSAGAVFRASAGLFVAAAALGVYLCVFRGGWPMLVLGAAGLLLAFFYTAGSIQYKYKGLGEFGIFLCYGPFLVVGTALIQTGRFVPSALFFSVPVGLHVAAILFANNMRDRDNDAKAGALTLVHLLGPSRSPSFYGGLIFAPYLLLAAAACRSAWLALPFCSGPLAWGLARDARKGELSLLPQKTAQFILVFGVLLVAAIALGRHFPH